MAGHVSAIHVLLTPHAQDVHARHEARHDEVGAGSLAMTEDDSRYFGCGTIRRYGFGAFQPCG